MIGTVKQYGSVVAPAQAQAGRMLTVLLLTKSFGTLTLPSLTSWLAPR